MSEWTTLIVGADADFFGQMVVDSILSVKTFNDMGDAVYPVRAPPVRVPPSRPFQPVGGRGRGPAPPCGC